MISQANQQYTMLALTSHLQGCRINASGVRALAESLKQNTSLRELSLSCTSKSSGFIGVMVFREKGVDICADFVSVFSE